LTDFNTAPSTNPFTGDIGTNDVEPNKRPRSSMAPVIVIAPNGEPIAAFGSPGGSTIINSVLNIAMNLIDHKMTVQDAIDAPRVSVTSAASTVALENGFPQGTIAGLAGLGY
jgi:gamma-glutamyltranspeptidase/glutathione hydrolase